MTDQMVNNIKGIHVNSTEKCDSFMKNGELIISDDKYFLGKGMYFWDNNSNAYFWYNRKQREPGKRSISKVVCNINIDNILDLTDATVIGTVDRLWRKYAKQKRINPDKKQPLGYVLDLLPLFNELPVRKAILEYNNSEGWFDNFLMNVKSCTFSLGSRVIYSVRKESMILSKVMHNMEEVI